MSRVLYRGVRLPDPEAVKKNGMRYYWETPDQAREDVRKALKTFGRDWLLENRHSCWGRLITQAISWLSEGRIQVWATEVRENAASYARNTPELIGEMLSYASIKREDRTKYLDETYGKPYIVAFTDPTDKHEHYNDINHPSGKFIEPERILSIEPTSVEGPDPYLQKLMAK